MKHITVVAPSNSMAHLPPALRDIGVQRLCKLGFSVAFGKHVDARGHHAVGTVAQRLSDIHGAYADPQTDIIMAAFGGYNANELLSHLDYDAINDSRKPFIGYSDITALLLGIQLHTTAPTIHGPGFASFCDPYCFELMEQSFLRALRGDTFTITAPDTTASDAWYLKDSFGPRELVPCVGWPTYRPGTASGPLVGGNLETITALLGTPYAPHTKGAILFLEDGGSATAGSFRRNITHLRQAGKADDIAGLLIGAFPIGHALCETETLFRTLDAALGDTSFPVMTGVHCSHVDPLASFPLGRQATVHATEAPQITIHTNNL